MQQAAPRAGRTLPGMPPEFDDPDEDGEPRLMRRRFGAGREEKKRGRWWWPASTAGRVFLAIGGLAAIGAIAVAGLTLKHDLERDARFRIAGTANIQATGLTEIGRAQLLPVFGEDIGRNVFFVPLNERRKQLEQIPWVERATVMRLLPDQIRVAVVERKPVAFTRHGQQIGLVDANGVLLTMPAATMAQRHYSFPVVTGIDPGDSAESRKARMAMYLRMMSELDAGGQHNSEQLSEIDLTDPEDARVLMPEQGRDILAHFGEDHFLERYERYRSHIAEWRQQYPQLAAVDLRYEDQVVLQMTSGTQKSDAPAAGDASSGGQAASPTASGDRQKPSAAAPAIRKSKPLQAKKHAQAKRAAAHNGRRIPATASRPTAIGAAAGMEQGG